MQKYPLTRFLNTCLVKKKEREYNDFVVSKIGQIIKYGKAGFCMVLGKGGLKKVLQNKKN